MERERMKNGLVLALWAFAALAFGADAPDDLQQRIDAARAKLDAAARELAELHKQDTFEIALPTLESRVSFGVLLAPSPEGVAIAGVTPGGPAEEAGIEAGDVIVTINGTNLRAGAGKPPMVRVFDVLKEATPGDIMRVEYVRRGEMRAADVTAADPLPMSAANVAFSTMAFSSGPGAPPVLGSRAMMGELELFDLNEDLGHYFGVSDGVLVLRAPLDKDGAGLLAGDVVRAINGRPVASSADCINAMGHVGDVAVEVLRDGAQLTVQTHNAVDAPSVIAMPPMGEAHAVRMISIDGQPGKKVEASGGGIVTGTIRQ